jgi:hypothetical protein
LAAALRQHERPWKGNLEPRAGRQDKVVLPQLPIDQASNLRNDDGGNRL